MINNLIKFFYLNFGGFNLDNIHIITKILKKILSEENNKRYLFQIFLTNILKILLLYIFISIIYIKSQIQN